MPVDPAELDEVANEAFRMKQESRKRTSSWIVLAAAGIAVTGIGCYFIFLRPPLLPEDLRFLALPASQLDIVRPRVEIWLARVFIVLGGYALATSVLTITLAVTSFRAHSRGAAIGVSIGGTASIGLMAAVNFVIGSDFKWVLLGIASLWFCSLVLFWRETYSSRRFKQMGIR